MYMADPGILSRRIPAHLRCTQCLILLHLIGICFLTCICRWQISQIQTCLVQLIFPQHQTGLLTMSAANSMDLTVIFTYIEYFTDVKVSSLSWRCKVIPCHCLCIKEVPIYSEQVRPKDPGMILIDECSRKISFKTSESEETNGMLTLLQLNSLV